MASLIAVIGIVSSIAAYLMIGSWESHLARLKFDEAAADELVTINLQLAAATNVLYTLQAYFEVPGQTITREDYGAFAGALRDRAVGLRDTGWAPRITEAGRAGFEAAVRAEGFPEFQIKQKNAQGKFAPAEDRAEHYPILYSEPAAINLPVLGFDLASEKQRRDAILRAIATGAPAATPPLQLVNIKRPSGGFMAFIPVYRGNGRDAALPGKPQGVLLAAFETGAMMDNILATQSHPADVNIYLLDPRSTGDRRVIYAHIPPGQSDPAPGEVPRLRGPYWTGAVQLVDQTLQAIITPGEAIGGGLWEWHALAALIGGLTGTTIIVWYLLASISHTRKLESLTSSLRAKTEELHHNIATATFLSTHDVLTGLPNRALFADRLEHALANAPRGGKRVAILWLDLDRFKEINDTLGHAAGDALLRVVASRMAGCLREGDTLARLGGDEFAVIQPHCVQEHDAEVLAGRLLEAASLPVDLDGGTAQIGLSIGIAISEAGLGAGQMLKNADMALYQAKGQGRHCWRFFSPEMNARLMERRELEAGLRAAVVEQDFCLLYQPLIDLRSRRVIGAEALLRWNRRGHGVVSPDVFIGVAEEIGLIGAIGRWVLREACCAAACWPEYLTVAVNVSPVQFRMSGFPGAVADALAISGLRPSRLEIEITEGILLNDTDETLTVLAHLRDMGVRLAMDDFGTGYSSLGYLQKFRFDKIKIDRGFIRRVVDDSNAAAIVRAVIALGDATGVRTLAEGVETRGEEEILILEGCREAQGYLYGKPMPAEAFAEFVRAPAALLPAW